MKWPAAMRKEFEDRHDRGERPHEIREAMSLTSGQFAGAQLRFHLHPHGVRRDYNPEHPSALEGRTRFLGQIVDAGDCLKPGQYSGKLGNRVTKGAWKGYPIYSLTLEERKTCPTDCKLWTGCYGNGMRFARRMRHGDELEMKLWRELSRLARRHPRGFVVRLHILGDFYSLGYVEFWREAIDAFPNLRVFGYTARQSETPIGAAIVRLREAHWDRFAVRTSGAARGPRTMVIESIGHKPADAIICPAQVRKKPRSCGECSLCWASKKPVAFLQH